MHFAADPDDLLYGRIPRLALCGVLEQEALTNWEVAAVTCQRCLEVMEERAAGISGPGVPQREPSPIVIHDEVIYHAPVMVPELWAEHIRKSVLEKWNWHSFARVKKKS